MNMHYPDPESLDEAWDCPTCGRPTPPSQDVECHCGMLVSHHVPATELCKRLRDAQQSEASLIVERDKWKKKFIQQNKDLGCEMMDPGGTIWDYAKQVQDENKRLKDQLEQASEQYRLSSVCRELKAENEKLKALLEEKEEFIQRVITWPHDADPFCSMDHDNDTETYSCRN